MKGITKYGGITLFLLYAFMLPGQNKYLSKNSAPKKVLKLYDKAKKAFKIRDYDVTKENLNHLLDKYPNFIDGHLLLAQYYADPFINDKKASENALIQAVEIDSLYDLRALFSLSRMHLDHGRYHEAQQCLKTLRQQKKFYLRYQNEVDEQMRKTTFAIHRLKDSIPITFIPLPETINTPSQEAFPTMDAYGLQLFFGRISGGQEDIFLSQYIDSTWKEALALPSPINSLKDESTQALSSDGNTLVFTACHLKNGLGSCDLYRSTRINNTWSVPENLGPEVNSPHWESQPCLANDGNTLLFSSNRPGGKGGKDLYVSHKRDGSWTKPQNLGVPVNTAGDEGAPFLHFSGQELYFMSNGHPGMGRQDIFLAKKSAELWDTVIHLPPPINSFKEEASLIVDLKGKRATYAVQQKGISDTRFRNMDIIQFDLPEAYQASLSAVLSGSVKHEQKAVDLASIEIYSLDGTFLKKLETDPNGHFLLTVSAGKNYGISVEKEGYIIYSEQFDLTHPKWLMERKILDIQLNKQKENEEIVLKNVFFDSGQAKLKEQSFQELDRLFSYLIKNSEIKIQVQGHTDDVGSEYDNLALSQKRAQAVQNYLVNKGLNASRIFAKGYGESNPIASNETEQGRKLNRRTSFKVLN